MERRRTPARVVACGVALASAVAASLAAQESRSPRAAEPPPELVQTVDKAFGCLVVNVPVKIVQVDVDQARRSITIVRLERASDASAWSRQLQPLAHAYWVTDFAYELSTTTNDLLSLVVAGVQDDGISLLERWTFTPDAAARDLPLESRPLPAVERSLLYVGRELGHLASVEIDWEARFVIALTLESESLWKIPLAAPFTPELLFAAATTASLRGMRSVHCYHHRIEGRRYELSSSHRLGADGQFDTTVVLRDPSNRGELSAPVAYRYDEWRKLGYDLLSSCELRCGRP